MTVKLELGQTLLSIRADGTSVQTEIIAFFTNDYSDIFALVTLPFIDGVKEIIIAETKESVDFDLNNFDPETSEIIDVLERWELSAFLVGKTCQVSDKNIKPNHFDICSPSNKSFWRKLYINESDGTRSHSQVGFISTISSEVTILSDTKTQSRNVKLLEFDTCNGGLLTPHQIGRTINSDDNLKVGVVIGVHKNIAFISPFFELVKNVKLHFADEQSIKEHNMQVLPKLNWDDSLIEINAVDIWSNETSTEVRTEQDTIEKDAQLILSSILFERPDLVFLSGDPIAIIVQWTITSSCLKENGNENNLGELARKVFLHEYYKESEEFSAKIGYHTISSIINQAQMTFQSNKIGYKQLEVDSE